MDLIGTFTIGSANFQEGEITYVGKRIPTHFNADETLKELSIDDIPPLGFRYSKGSACIYNKVRLSSNEFLVRTKANPGDIIGIFRHKNNPTAYHIRRIWEFEKNEKQLGFYLNQIGFAWSARANCLEDLYVTQTPHIKLVVFEHEGLYLAYTIQNESSTVMMPYKWYSERVDYEVVHTLKELLIKATPKDVKRSGVLEYVNDGPRRLIVTISEDFSEYRGAIRVASWLTIERDEYGEYFYTVHDGHKEIISRRVFTPEFPNVTNMHIMRLVIGE